MNDDDRLRGLLSDAVSGIEPADRLEELRASVHPSPKVVPMARPRSWYPATGIIATAAVIGVVAYATHVVGDRSKDLGPATDTSTGGPSATATAVDPSARTPRTGSIAVYYLGRGPHGAVLYRELRTCPAGAARLDAAVASLATEPRDPDYRTPWRAGWLVRASRSGGLISVEVGRAPAARPPSMSAREATEAVQQVVYTLEAAAQQRDRVQFVRHGRPVESLFGVTTSGPVSPGRVTRVLSSMSIGSPAEAARIARGPLVVSGLDHAAGAAVVVRLVRRGVTYLEQSTPAINAYDAERMFPWRVTLDTSGLPAGRYTLVAVNEGGDGGRDTRNLVLH